MSETPISGMTPRVVEGWSPQRAEGERGPGLVHKAGPGVISVELTSSRLSRGEGPTIVSQRHDMPMPGANAALGMRDLGGVATANLDVTVDALCMVKSLMSETISLMADIQQKQHRMMGDARKDYIHSVDKKVSTMREQAACTMGIGITTALVGGIVSGYSAYIGFTGENAQITLAQSQAVSGVGHALQGIGEAWQKGVNTELEAKIAKDDMFANVYQGFQGEFKEAVDNAQQAMSKANQALSEAGSKDDQRMGVAISKLG